MNFWMLVVLTCVSMIFKDAVGITMQIAEARGNAKLSAMLNPLGTIAQVAFFSFGAVQLLHYGWRGVLGLVPVLIIDTIDGFYFTKWGRKIRDDADGTVPAVHRRHRWLHPAR
jgi:hypothetical protein